MDAFLFDSHLEICLQNGSVFCICRSACNLSVVSDLGVVLGVSVTSGVTASDWGCGVGFVVLHWAVLLLVLYADPLRLVADNICTVDGLSCGNSTSLGRQSAALL